jgi:hypothetical protein
MIKKGLISSISDAKARVTFPDMGNVVSKELPICTHVTGLVVGDAVIVAFWGNNLTDGSIIGKVM